MLAGGIRMYRHEDYEQLKLELPFGVKMCIRDRSANVLMITISLCTCPIQ